MPDETIGQYPTGNPENPSPTQPTPSPIEQGVARESSHNNLIFIGAKDVNWIHKATLWSQIGLVLIGAWALWVYQGQLTVMKGTLNEMKRSGEQSTEQMWSAIDNINWEARSMDLSEKQSEKSLKATIENSHQDLRAWVGVESVVPNNFARPLGLLGNIQLDVDFGLRNYGRSVAERIRIYPELRIMSAANRHDPACKTSYEKNDLGYNLVPTETLHATYGMNVSAREIEEAIKSQHGDRNLFLKVVGCIVYSDGLSKTETHHTPFSYALELKDNVAYVTADTIAIDNSLLRLNQLVIYTGPAD